MTWDVIQADVLDWCAGYQGEPFHAILCDPPYHLTSPSSHSGTQPTSGVYGRVNGGSKGQSGGFMGKRWDGGSIAFQSATWAALAEHLHPGAFGMSFASARGWHRLAVAIEDAGLVFHPSIFMLGWIQGQGFPKSTRIGKNGDHPEFEGHRYGLQAMKPCLEPIILFQKPYSGRPVDSIMATGAGALWIDGGRVATGDNDPNQSKGATPRNGQGANEIYGQRGQISVPNLSSQGRWPPNVCLSHVSPQPCPACDGDGCPDCGGTGWLEGCRRVGTKRVKSTVGWTEKDRDTPNPGDFGSGGFERSKAPMTYADPDGLETVDDFECIEGCPVRELGEQSGESTNTRHMSYKRSGGEFIDSIPNQADKRWWQQETGTAARFYPNHSWQYEIEERLAGVTPFYYCAKSSRRERDSGLEGFDRRATKWQRPEAGVLAQGKNPVTGKRTGNLITPPRNHHPCCKPISLVKWLATLLLPPPEYAPRRLLVPFGGVMSEAIGGILAGWDEVVAIEMEEEYIPIANARCRFWAGWSERGHDDPKTILKEAAKEAKKQPEPQMELL